MTTIEHDDAGLADFMAGWDKRLEENEQLPVGFAVLVLTDFGEKPVPSVRLVQRTLERADPHAASLDSCRRGPCCRAAGSSARRCGYRCSAGPPRR